MPIGLTTAIVGGAAIAGAATIGAGAMSAHAQKSAANQASNTQLQIYNQNRNDLAPFRAAGADATNQLMARMGDLTSPFSMTQANLEQTPGYQFTRDQGLKAVNNAIGARGLFNSGAVMKGAANFATGLADNTYMDQFNMDQTQKTNAYNKLYGAAGLGENAAAQTGAFGTQAGQQVGQNIIGGANATAGALMSGAGAIGNTANSLSQAMLMNKLFGQGGSGTAGIYGAATPAYTGYGSEMNGIL